MQVATVKMTFSRTTGKKLKEEIVGISEVDEDEYYRPLVELLAPQFLEWLKQQEEVKTDGYK